MNKAFAVENRKFKVLLGPVKTRMEVRIAIREDAELLDEPDIVEVIYTVWWRSPRNSLIDTPIKKKSGGASSDKILGRTGLFGCPCQQK